VTKEKYFLPKPLEGFDMNIHLKLAIVASQKPAYHIAAELGITDTRLSKIIYGRLEPKVEEKKKLSNILEKSQKELFPDDHSGVN
jgi:hypothetical protein